MVPLLARAGLLCLVFSAAAIAENPVKGPDSYRDEALVFERFETTMRMRADGTGERIVHSVLRIQSEGAARQFAVLSFSYASASETPNIKLVRVHKADGTTIDTPASDAIEMAAAITRNAPVYSDLKEKHVPVRSLSVGDKLEYEVETSIDKAEAPGQFWGANHFTAPGSFVVLAEVLTLEVPREKYVQVWSPNHKPSVTEHDKLKVYTWNVPQLIPAPTKTSDQGDDAAAAAGPKDPDQDADGRNLPSVAWTTFHSWAEVGDWYRGLSLARARPTNALRARSDEITKSANTPEEQVREIYKFVSSRTRYVGIDFGVGRYQPHAADEVLTNQYGDCKDKDTLLEALLRAKGFATAPALIGAGIVAVPEVPSPAVFNHVITTVKLPSGRIWLDSTPEVAPFQYLSAVIRDEEALVVPPDAAAALEKTPATAPYPFVSRFEAVATLDVAGKLSSHMTASYRSDDEIFVRALARSVAPAEWDKVSQLVSSNTGFSGTTSNTRFKGIDDLSVPLAMTYDYSRHPFGDWDNHRIVPLFPFLEFPSLTKYGPGPTEDIQLGAPRTLTAITRIQLPPTFRTDLPDPVHVKTDFATFDKTYRFNGKEITVERDIAILKKKLPKSEWKRYQSFCQDIGMDGEPWIQIYESTSVSVPLKEKIEAAAKKEAPLGPGSKTAIVEGDGGPASAPVSDGAESLEGKSANELVQIANRKVMSRDYSSAVPILDKVKATHPDQQYLWANYGLIAMAQGRRDEAIADCKKELAKYPDNSPLVNNLAAMESASGGSETARHTLQSYIRQHPGDVQTSMYLAALQTYAEDNLGALKTLQDAAEKNPDDRLVRLQLSRVLLILDRKDEAAAAAKSVLDGTDNVGLQNDAAYVLADAGLDLAEAEEISRKSIKTLEDKSAAITTAEVNSRAFADSNLLLASWDTLGWILFREGKVEEAKTWILVSWRNSLSPECGDQVGQLYEALGEKKDAYSAYVLARAAIQGSNAAPLVRRHIDESIARLKGADTKPASRPITDTLQDLRTYKIFRPKDLSGWGTFRLQIAANGVFGSQQMSGEQKLASMMPAINVMKFPELVPPESKAHLLRSAVVSCSMTPECELVFVPNGNLALEQ